MLLESPLHEAVPTPSRRQMLVLSQTRQEQLLRHERARPAQVILVVGMIVALVALIFILVAVGMSVTDDPIFDHAPIVEVKAS